MNKKKLDTKCFYKSSKRILFAKNLFLNEFECTVQPLGEIFLSHILHATCPLKSTYCVDSLINVFHVLLLLFFNRKLGDEKGCHKRT